MTKLFSYYNKTAGGTLRAFALTKEKVEAKIAALAIEYPENEFEIVEVEIVTVIKKGFLPGRGRAGNSYAASWGEKRIRPVEKKFQKFFGCN